MEWDLPQIISSRVTAEDRIISRVTLHTYIWTWYILRTFALYILIVWSLFLGFSRTLAFYHNITVTFLGFSRLPCFVLHICHNIHRRPFTGWHGILRCTYLLRLNKIAAIRILHASSCSEWRDLCLCGSADSEWKPRWQVLVLLFCPC